MKVAIIDRVYIIIQYIYNILTSFHVTMTSTVELSSPEKFD